MFVTGKCRIFRIVCVIYKENKLPDQKKAGQIAKKSGLILDRTFDVLQFHRNLNCKRQLICVGDDCNIGTSSMSQ